MDIKKLSFFIIAVGVILVALGAVHWRMAENEAEHRGDFRKEMLMAQIKELDEGNVNAEQRIRQLKLEMELNNEINNDIRMVKMGYKSKVDHTISYSLMIGGMLAIIMGVGMRISSLKKSDTVKIA